MRITLALITLAVTAALFTPALAQSPGPRPPQGSIHQPAPRLPATEQSARGSLRALGTQGGDFPKVARDPGRNELKTRNRRGRAVKLHVDPATGRIRRPLQERTPGAGWR